jgi:cell division transport system permease protein
MNSNSFRYCLRQGYLSLFRNFWLAVVTAGMIAVSLAILGGFLLVAANAGQIMRSIESTVDISVFLYDDADVEEIRQKLIALEGVESLAFVSKEEGLTEFSRTLGDRVPLSDLEGENNPLPDMYRVRVARTDLVPALSAEIQTMAGVEAADYGEQLVLLLTRITGWLNRLLLTVGTLLALGSVFLIITVIRLSVLARQEEIGVMKYLGASNWFIRFPFLIEGMVMGWMGTLVAVLGMGLAYGRLAAFLQRETIAFFLQPVTHLPTLFTILAGLLVAGTVMGGLGSLLSVRKYLRV